MDDFEWTVVNDGHLLNAMVGHKPVGINKYFQMAFIWDKLTDCIKKDVQSTKIWSHLETMYNLEALDENESLPFPNDEREFNLPEAEFGALLLKKDEKPEEKKPPTKGRETPKLIKEVKKEESRAPSRNSNSNKDTPRRDSKDKEVKELKTPVAKKEIKKETPSEKPKAATKGSRNSLQALKDELKSGKGKSTEETPTRPVKRPTRGSLKPDEGSNGGGKASPVNTPGVKRRRI